ncbi:MAG: protease [Candidatus Marinimicrobia bacterium]|nr:protease [Candidatus Neomarinimicrobiota bacterium]|tara:strand:- start:18038 stop:19384 length:1347 start_codon:yes stop_codon:yes gene_type:complete
MNIFIALFLSISISFSNYNQFNQAFIDVSKEQSSSIVSIVSEKTEQIQDMFFFNPFFDDFGFDKNPNQKERKSRGLGSGVIIDKDNGYIITNAHVIDDAEEVKVILFDKREINANIIAVDVLSDIAVIQIDSDNLQEAKPGDSENLQIGEWIIAIGSPFGLHLNHTVTAGIVSAVGRTDVVSRRNFENFIQHDAAINPGNSGGGLFNLNGELVGINTAIATDGFSKSNAGVGFAVPINQVMRVIDDLINEGKVLRGYLGVQIGPIDNDMMKALGLDSKEGALIAEVVKDSPADIAGLNAKDVIIGMNSIPISDYNELRNKVSSAKPGDVIVFNILRNKISKNIVVTLGLRPSEDQLYAESNSLNYDLLGFKVENNKDGKGILIIDIDSSSNAYDKNIRIGDIITELGNEIINNIDEYKNILESYSVGDAIMIRVVSNGSPRYEAFEIN